MLRISKTADCIFSAYVSVETTGMDSRLLHWRRFLKSVRFIFMKLGWGDRRKYVKWSASERKIGNIGRMKEGLDFAINSIFDGADLGNEKNWKW